MLLAVLACAHAAEPLRSYPILGSSLTISVPTNWTQVEPQSETAFAVQSPKDPKLPDIAPVSISAAKEVIEKRQSTAEFAAASLAVLKRLLTGVKVIENAPTTINRREWQRIHYQFRSGQQTWEQLLYATVDGSTGWCVTFSCAPDQWTSWQETFDVIAMSLKK